jgi:RES domain-containing protein
MRRLWRINNHGDLAGTGGLVAPGRWHHRGSAIVYCSENAATALLETLVHLEIDSLQELPLDYQLLEIGLPTGFRAKPAVSLPEDWRDRVALTRDLGSRWLAESRHVALRVPSAVVAQTYNVLLNPRLVPQSGIRIVAAARYPFDERLLERVRRGPRR